MTGIRLTTALVLACALSALPAPAGSAKSVTGERMIDAINWSRAEAGLRELEPSPRLIRSARVRARRMMRSDFFAHPRTLRVRTFGRVGEVIALHPGRRPRVTRTLRRWAASAGHARILRSRELRRVGAARAVGRYRGHRATIWVVRLGRRG